MPYRTGTMFLQSNELVLIKEFLRNIGFEKDFDDHVFKDSQFLLAATNLSYKWKTFVELKRAHCWCCLLKNIKTKR